MPKAIAAFFVLLALAAAPALATPEFVTHAATTPVFGEPSGTTMRQPAVLRGDERVDVCVEVGYSLYNTDIAIYDTTDGSTRGGNR